LETLIRALQYHPGRVFVVPLFSEVDGDVEYDTLTVLNPKPPGGDAFTWRVRFADPAVTSEYIVDARSRELLEFTSRNRGTGTEFHVRAMD
jgi:hypothetical protein